MGGDVIETQGLTDEQRRAAGQVPIGDKWYKLVSARVQEFREGNPNHCIDSLVTYTDKTVRVRCEIKSAEGRLLATGSAEKRWSNGSASQNVGVERAETAAVGRALGFLGFSGATDIASADEVYSSLLEELEDKKKDLEKLKRLIDALDRNWEEVYTFRRLLAEERWYEANTQYIEISDKDKTAIFGVAPTKGGLLSTQERDLTKNGEGMVAARKQRREELERESKNG